ncbi:hypothetical protein DL93DRAFT_778915 [Clavulina sp. PMI_390]|nr:hypothetical protein DL93DRAFT_778915 [Clavulina sp. PMI_390]
MLDAVPQFSNASARSRPAAWKRSVSSKRKSAYESSMPGKCATVSASPDTMTQPAQHRQPTMTERQAPQSPAAVNIPISNHKRATETEEISSLLQSNRSGAPILSAAVPSPKLPHFAHHSMTSNPHSLSHPPLTSSPIPRSPPLFWTTRQITDPSSRSSTRQLSC